MMKDTTKKAIAENLERIGANEFQPKDIQGITFDTFRKYVKVQKVVTETFEEVSIEDLVDLLNSCAGDDCYNCDWEYRVIDGKPYEVYKWYSYKVAQ